jgi:hypothetical protein
MAWNTRSIHISYIIPPIVHSKPNHVKSINAHDNEPNQVEEIPSTSDFHHLEARFGEGRGGSRRGASGYRHGSVSAQMESDGGREDEKKGAATR